MATTLGIQAEFLQENMHKLLDSLQSSTLGRVVLPINEDLLEPAKALWNTPALLPSTAKLLEKQYLVPMQGFEGFYSHPAPNLLVITAANDRAWQGKFKSTPKDKESRR
ncbi:hypothetical protein KIL84_013937 [Mauremys mutica]|uniref:Uncharacterized protein n=1 Tax=Mauremys mutica TaxID=74926 RepID=A0A9D4ANG7_9SAUR|nr:hypothetical protein KIL84_013937 [Mauremys mutica]